MISASTRKWRAHWRVGRVSSSATVRVVCGARRRAAPQPVSRRVARRASGRNGGFALRGPAPELPNSLLHLLGRHAEGLGHVADGHPPLIRRLGVVVVPYQDLDLLRSENLTRGILPGRKDVSHQAEYTNGSASCLRLWLYDLRKSSTSLK